MYPHIYIYIYIYICKDSVENRICSHFGSSRFLVYIGLWARKFHIVDVCLGLRVVEVRCDGHRAHELRGCMRASSSLQLRRLQSHDLPLESPGVSHFQFCYLQFLFPILCFIVSTFEILFYNFVFVVFRF